ncbi:FHA domain-containing protein [Streptomyces lonegramiae]|uniref:FtsK/SpoIIIE domain-containing protein n=1 Tax=Streptomyces lonegramiae TaxID=3075524 RepID=A0ABU2XLY6_9ACTN|nr:FHA domain-containing protein [Streptomyces sp. DSM 41529]MDT0546934.1 FtsK/SpoIIIE domain-containing protein [Streptomyces sp. DSM 41529]
MQIRLTVLGPRSAHPGRPGQPAPGHVHAGPCAVDVLITAPAGTALASVTGGLAAALAAAGCDTGGGSGAAVLYAGAERLDAQRCALGEPPLVDGAVLALNTPADPDRYPGYPGLPEAAAPDAAVRLDVVAGPDAGGVHLLHGGQVRIGRSAEADVPLDDPDVSRIHCAVTVADDGRVTIADLGSTNGTAVDGAPVGPRAVPLPPEALLRIGESALRLRAPGPSTAPPERLPAHPDGEGHLRVTPQPPAPPSPGPAPAATTTGQGDWLPGGGPAARPGGVPQVPEDHGSTAAYGEPYADQGSRNRAGHPAPGGAPAARGAGGGWRADDHALPGTDENPTHYGASGLSQGPWAATGAAGAGAAWAEDAPGHGRADEPARPGAGAPGGPAAGGGADHTHAGAPGGQPGGLPGGLPGGYDVAGAQVRRRGGIGAWARRLASGLGAGERDEADGAEPGGDVAGQAAAEAAALHRRWPDPAVVLMTALGPGPRLWERDPAHPDALTVRLGSTDRPAVGGGLLPVAPVTVDLREAGSLGLAGPRARLAGLARSVVAQLAALHSPTALEIVLVSTDHRRAVAERLAEWSWLGWLPHAQPLRGQDCRLLLAFDPEQATARTNELVRRLEDGRPGPGWATASPAAVAAAAARHSGPYTLVVVDGDPGPAALRETLAALALGGPAGGVHLLSLVEAPAASPTSPLPASYGAARSASPVFAACGVAALLSGDVATGLQIVRRGGQDGAAGAVATVDAVSAAWAERFARALAPLRPADSAVDGGGSGRAAAAPLPRTSRLLDELGLARATPASLLARWAAAADEVPAGGQALAVLGAGPRGPLVVDLVADGPHLLIGGGPGTGKTELLRSLAASLAAAERPDRLGLVLVDGGGAERGEGLRVCTDLPQVSTYLAASDPVRMREFAQALSSELKQRAELLGDQDFVTWHAQRPATPAWTTGGDAGSVGVSAASARSAGGVGAQLPGGARPSTAADSAAGGGTARRPDVPDRSTGERPSTGDASARGAGGRAGIGNDGSTAHRPDAPDRSTGYAPVRGAGERPSTDGGTARHSDAEARNAGYAPGRGTGARPSVDDTSARGASSRAGGGTYAGTDGGGAGGRTAVSDASAARGVSGGSGHADSPGTGGTPAGDVSGARVVAPRRAGDLDAPASGSTLRLRTTQPGREDAAAAALPRLVVLVDDFDALVAPALGSTGRPAAGSVVRALEAVARDGARLGVHLIAASGRPDRTADTAAAERAGLWITLEARPLSPSAPGALTGSGADSGAGSGAAEAAIGRGQLHRRRDDSAPTPFQAGRVTGRIPRTATQRPTVVAVDWERVGDPPARRPVRELGNGPTDLALLASALQRAAQSAGAPTAPALI